VVSLDAFARQTVKFRFPHDQRRIGHRPTVASHDDLKIRAAAASPTDAVFKKLRSRTIDCPPAHVGVTSRRAAIPARVWFVSEGAMVQWARSNALNPRAARLCAHSWALVIHHEPVFAAFGAPCCCVPRAPDLARVKTASAGIRFDDAHLAFAIAGIALAVVLFDYGFEDTLAELPVAARPALVSLNRWRLVTIRGIRNGRAGLVGGILVSNGPRAAARARWSARPTPPPFLPAARRRAPWCAMRAPTLEIESGPTTRWRSSSPPAPARLSQAKGGLGRCTRDLALEFLARWPRRRCSRYRLAGPIAALLRRLPLERALRAALRAEPPRCACSRPRPITRGSGGYLPSTCLASCRQLRITESVALRRFQGAFNGSQIVKFITWDCRDAGREFPVGARRIARARRRRAHVRSRRPLARLCLLAVRLLARRALLTGWVGLRGAVSLLLAILPLLAGVEHARTMFNVTFEIVLVSLLMQGWTLVPVARRLRQVVPARSGPVERNALDMPGLDGHELVCYRIAEHSPIAAGATLPRWSRPSLVVRRGESMRIREAGPLQPGDLVYLIVKDDRIALLDRIFAATRQPEKSDREFFGDFALAPDVTLSDIAASYGVGVPLRDAGLTVAEALSREFDAAPTVGDRLRLGAVELIVRDVDVGGRVAEVGLALRAGARG
jgi:cell volume regulation protein A